jgi:hypothetical protein
VAASMDSRIIETHIDLVFSSSRGQVEMGFVSLLLESWRLRGYELFGRFETKLLVEDYPIVVHCEVSYWTIENDTIVGPLLYIPL